MSSRTGLGDIRGVLFDFGYTLFAHAPLFETIGNGARRLSVQRWVTSKPQRWQLASMLQRCRRPSCCTLQDLDSAVWAERWRVLYGIADEAADGLGDALFASMHDPEEWIPYRDTATTLRILSRRGISIGIVSNTGWNVRDVFSAHSLSDTVAWFVLSYEIGLVKPDRQIFRDACHHLEVVTGDVLMVGDDPRSDGGAVSAGIRTLLLPRALPPGSDNGVGAVLDLAGIGE